MAVRFDSSIPNGTSFKFGRRGRIQLSLNFTSKVTGSSYPTLMLGIWITATDSGGVTTQTD